MHNALSSVAFGSLATWLDRQQRAKEAGRVRAIEGAANVRFGEIEEALSIYLVNYVVNIGKGTEWDPEALISTALQMVGGEAAVTRVVAASRDVRLAAFKAPAAAFYMQQKVDPTEWAEDNAKPGLVQIKGNSQLLPVRASLRIPLTFYRFMIEGAPYGNALGQARSNAPLYAAPDAEQAYKSSLSQATTAMVANSGLPLKDTFAALLTEDFNEEKSPADNSERAMAYVAAIPNICLTAFLAAAPGYLGQDVLEQRYIPSLKNAGRW
ncbi:MAG: hypothetical protein DI537_05330 [Stutzerimonas stutzeri]|nr:MAG: hypothetical protein DI537_05330 [Stutzerimonas stutzeri]